jgi:hypothetical protein
VNDVQASLNYYAQRNCSEQWRVFLSEMISEFYDQVDSGMAESFFHRVGTRLAQALPLPPCGSLDEVATGLNRLFDQLEWGWVEVREAGSHIQIVHGAYPVVPMYQNAPEAWILPVLEGAYTEWFRSLGGQPELQAKVVNPPESPFFPVELSYGRHG